MGTCSGRVPRLRLRLRLRPRPQPGKHEDDQGSEGETENRRKAWPPASYPRRPAAPRFHGSPPAWAADRPGGVQRAWHSDHPAPAHRQGSNRSASNERRNHGAHRDRREGRRLVGQPQPRARSQTADQTLEPERGPSGRRGLGNRAYTRCSRSASARPDLPPALAHRSDGYRTAARLRTRCADAGIRTDGGRAGLSTQVTPRAAPRGLPHRMWSEPTQTGPRRIVMTESAQPPADIDRTICRPLPVLKPRPTQIVGVCRQPHHDRSGDGSAPNGPEAFGVQHPAAMAGPRPRTATGGPPDAGLCRSWLGLAAPRCRHAHCMDPRPTCHPWWYPHHTPDSLPHRGTSRPQAPLAGDRSLTRLTRVGHPHRRRPTLFQEDRATTCVCP